MSTMRMQLRFTQALHSRSFLLLWLGQTISLFGDGVFLIALAWQILLLTGSATAMGIVLAAQVVPRILFLLLGGVAADRLSPRAVMLCSDAGRAVLVGTLAGLSWLHLLQIWHIVVLALCFGMIQGFFYPAYQAIRPQLVESPLLSSANALTGISLYMSQLLGPFLGAGMVTLAGPAGAFLFDGLTFVVSTFCLLVLRLPTALPEVQETLSERQAQRQQTVHRGSLEKSVKHVVTDVREGLHYVTGSTWLWLTIVVASVGNIGWNGPMVAVLPKLVYSVYKAPIWFYGILQAMIAVGSMLAAVLVGQFVRQHRRGLLAYCSLLLASLSVLLLGLPIFGNIRLIIAIGASFGFGFGVGAFSVLWETLLQQGVPDGKLGRVSSIDFLGSTCLLPLGYAIMGLVADRLGPVSAFLLGGVLNLMLAGIALSVRSVRTLA